MSGPAVDSLLESWARNNPSIAAVALIGSRERASSDPIWAADGQSDWDFQIIAKDPMLFETADWLKAIPELKVLAYAPRSTRIGSVPKVNILFDGAECDLVIIPARALAMARFLVNLGFHKRSKKLFRSLQDLAIVIRPGWRFLKGKEVWDRFYAKVVADVSDARLSDREAKRLAEVFVCAYVWVARKIERGEYLTAQRTLHQELAETNLRFLHECRLREGLRSFPEARRIERIAASDELSQVGVSARPDRDSLSAALERSAQTCRELMHRLVGESWAWPAGIRFSRQIGQR